MLYSLVKPLVLVSIFLFLSCDEKVKKESVDVPLYYLSELTNASFFDSVKPISMLNVNNRDVADTNISYAEKGSQNINLRSTLESAAKQNKPLLIYFTGFACVNCRKMEAAILDNKVIHTLISNEFVFIPLSVDDRTRLPESHWQKKPNQNENTTGGKPLSRIGQINAYFQTVLTQMGSQPLFIVLDENRYLGDINFTKDVNEFSAFLKHSIEKYNE